MYIVISNALNNIIQYIECKKSKLFKNIFLLGILIYNNLHIHLTIFNVGIQIILEL